jgi:drug/metabolite transporter (DMT)-like permease
MLWILLTAAAAPLQVARNALQRGLIGDAGPWGATLVRFLFGLPFALAIFGVVAILTPEASPHLSWRFVVAILAGALAQVGATASLLVAMRRSGFAVATVMQQCSLPFAAVLGFVAFGETLSPQAWAGIAAASAGLLLASWPKQDQPLDGWTGALLGVISGAAFAVALEPRHPIFAGTAGVCVAQAFQAATLSLWLAARRPGALRAVAASWRASLGAGFCGAAASACWFAALAISPAGPVRAVGVIEMPIAAAAGRRLFRERLTLRQAAGGVLTALGVVATALG